MKLHQMFPKQTLDAEDLFALAPQGATVTIERIDYKTYESDRVGEAEISYFLFTREFKKPFRLNKQNAQTIEQVLGLDDTDDWVNHHITVHGVRKKITDRDTGKPKQIWVIDVDMVAPRTPPSLPAKQDITGLSSNVRAPSLPGRVAAQAPALTSGGGEGTIGIDRAVGIVAGLTERGKNVADVQAHLESIGLGEQIAGKELPDWPMLMVAIARKLVQDFPRVRAPLTDQEKAAVRLRWERPPAAPAPAAPRRENVTVRTPAPPASAHPEYEEIAADDIPF